MKCRYIVVFLLGLISSVAPAQDAHFSQFYASGLYLNPSMAGIEPGWMGGINYRNQWKSIVVPYVTSQLTVIAPIYTGKGKKAHHHGGIGFSIYNDKSGDGNFRTLGANINAAYNISLSSNTVLTLGIQGGFIQKSIDFDKFQWGEQYNPYLGFDATIPPSETTISSRRLYPDIGAGAIYAFRTSKKETALKGFFGLSGYHLNQPNESLVRSTISKLPVLMKAHGGVEIPLNEKFSLSPNVLGMMQNSIWQTNTGMYLNFKFYKGGNVVTPSDLIIGGWYRLKDSFIFLAGFGNKNYLFGFSYDLNNSTLRYNTKGRGAWEISLSIRQFKPRDAARRFHTPRI